MAAFHARLPSRHLRHHLGAHRADVARRHLGLLQWLSMCLYLARRVAPRLGQMHVGIKLRQTPHPGRPEQRMEAPVAVARNLGRQCAGLRNTVFGVVPLWSFVCPGDLAWPTAFSRCLVHSLSGFARRGASATIHSMMYSYTCLEWPP